MYLPCRILIPLFLALTLEVAHTRAFTVFGGNYQQAMHQTAFASAIPSLKRSANILYSMENDKNIDDNSSDEEFDLSVLQKRIGELRLKIMEEDVQRPPNANLNPRQFVEAVLEGLFYNEDPRPDAGFMLFLRCSSEKWASTVLRSIGAPQSASLDTVAHALGSAIARPHNQFAILVGDNDDEDDYDTEERNFDVHFPGETLDFLDGTAWINVEFRDKRDNSLLVLMGWQLCQREDGAWLIDQIDWQDYREEYRPGIGREEWMPYEGRRR